ncbi:unnamed protein product [Closterium sp. Yama58-4]|nr:unnamed protein product [Closterium sp. Yama58-4]
MATSRLARDVVACAARRFSVLTAFSPCRHLTSASPTRRNPSSTASRLPSKLASPPNSPPRYSVSWPCDLRCRLAFSSAHRRQIAATSLPRRDRSLLIAVTSPPRRLAVSPTRHIAASHIRRLAKSPPRRLATSPFPSFRPLIPLHFPPASPPFPPYFPYFPPCFPSFPPPLLPPPPPSPPASPCPLYPLPSPLLHVFPSIPCPPFSLCPPLYPLPSLLPPVLLSTSFIVPCLHPSSVHPCFPPFEARFVPSFSHPFLPSLIPSSPLSSLPPFSHPFLPSLIPSSLLSSLPPFSHPFLPSLIPSSPLSSLSTFSHPFLPSLIPSSLLSSLPPFSHPFLPSLIPSSLLSSLPPFSHPFLPSLIPSSLLSSLPPFSHPFLPSLIPSSLLPVRDTVLPGGRTAAGACCRGAAVQYPLNLTVGNLCYFMAAPARSYQVLLATSASQALVSYSIAAGCSVAFIAPCLLFCCPSDCLCLPLSCSVCLCTCAFPPFPVSNFPAQSFPPSLSL